MSVYCNTEFWSLSSVYLSGYVKAKHFQFWTRCFLNWDSMVLDGDA